ncbi:GatB/YqeY domain-containing protein [Clostridium tagluense]|uniref:GatB/YqeY domain-containing protein n=1 Tax=Clostridium TaxID=1485 RepID=UPI0013E94B6B|nr:MULTISPECIES: GatB/YqeY domain-containing protein [Clostridium]MBW9157275.1 GatB/YqeY domain-containing protein [Clostridium tagluense]MBZ9623411.1 GatB/YqeY domain-containing protein [Clostridium sp. FP2]MCB2310933.1 GatB/YqeY domain-containing protein [Clostridium tagluense]MCB2315787.1 GatB/YqeY domain-containing protein [Clostridium tagluense]MCB2320569.1 GatB/YqeY domain-containing protein [Clostridium tagluense]
MLKQTLKDDIIKYMKSKDKIRLTALRTLMAEVKYKEMDLKKELEDNELIGIIEKTIKQLNETLSYAKQASKEEIIAETEIAIEMFTVYMPKQFTDEEAKAIVIEVIAENGFKGNGDMGKVMKAVMPHLKGKYDSKKINPLVKELLA